MQLQIDGRRYFRGFAQSDFLAGTCLRVAPSVSVDPRVGPSCTNVAIGGDRLYVTGPAIGTVLVADISELR